MFIQFLFSLKRMRRRLNGKWLLGCPDFQNILGDFLNDYQMLCHTEFVLLRYHSCTIHILVSLTQAFNMCFIMYGVFFTLKRTLKPWSRSSCRSIEWMGAFSPPPTSGKSISLCKFSGHSGKSWEDFAWFLLLWKPMPGLWSLL